LDSKIIIIIIGLVVAVSVLATIVVMDEIKSPQEKMVEVIVENMDMSNVDTTNVDPYDPLSACINDRPTPFKIKATLEIFIDGEKVDIPANALNSEECQRSMYTLTNDGTIYAESEKEFPFEIGHFLWMWDFPLRDMDQGESTVFVDGVESVEFINHSLENNSHYKMMFVTKN
jgi:hypothetical protein